MANFYYSNGSSFTQITPALLGAAAANHTHSYLPLSGGTLTGAVTHNAKNNIFACSGGSWVSGMTQANSPIAFPTAIVKDGSRYDPYMWGKNTDGDVWNFGGGANNTVGFWGFKHGRTANGTDWGVTINVTSGVLSSSAGFSGSLSGKATSAGTADSATTANTCTGNSATASKWATARTLSLTGGVTGSVSMDGSANASLSTTVNWLQGTNCYVTTDSVAAPYWRFATFSSGGDWVDASAVFCIQSGYENGGFGIFTVQVRNDQISSTGTQHAKVIWLCRQGFSANQIIAKTYTAAKETCYTDIYFKATGAYNGANIRILNTGARGSNANVFTLLSDSPRAAMDTRKYTNTYEGYDGGTVSYANSAGSASSATTASKLGSSTVGSSTKPIYLSSGTATASSSTIGGAAKPMYLSSGTMTACSSTVGGTTTPVYMNAGTITACSYTLAKSVPSDAKFTDTNTWRGIQNNLTSTSTSDSLAANQGKVLNEKINNTVIVSSTQPTSSDCKIWIKI